MGRPMGEFAELGTGPRTVPGALCLLIRLAGVTKPQRATSLCPDPQCWVFRSVQGHA